MTGMVGRFGRIFLRYGCKTLLLLLAVSVIAFALVRADVMTCVLVMVPVFIRAQVTPMAATIRRKTTRTFVLRQVPVRRFS